MRKSYILREGRLVESDGRRKRPKLLIMSDLPAYESPIDGRVVEGRRARREDLARSGCRPYEGREQEEKEAARQRGYAEKQQDASLDASVRRAYHQVHPDLRAKIEGRK